MRRVDLINGCKEIKQAIDQSRLVDLFRIHSRSSTGDRASVRFNALLDALLKFAIRADNFSPAARGMADILGIYGAMKTESWMLLVEGEGQGRSLAYQLYRIFDNISSYLPKIIDLLQQEGLEQAKKSIRETTPEHPETSLLSVIIIEESGQFSTPDRIISVLDSIQLLYRSYAIMTEVNPDSLSVVACDSGSDKSLDLLGVAKVVDSVKELILGLWDKIVFFREYQMEQRLALVAQSLPVLEQIATLEQEQKISPEQAGVLKRDITVGVHKFIESGALA